MVKSKTELFDHETRECALFFKAISHPARIAILKYLAQTRVCITGDISGELPLSRSTVNQHLAELKKAGLIQGQIDGVNTRYCLKPETVARMREMATELFVQLEATGTTTC